MCNKLAWCRLWLQLCWNWSGWWTFWLAYLCDELRRLLMLIVMLNFPLRISDGLLFVPRDGRREEWIHMHWYLSSLPDRPTGMRQINISRWDSVRISRSQWTVISIGTASKLLTVNCSSLVCWNMTFWSNKSQENWACVEFGERRSLYHSLALETFILGKT